MRAGPRSRGGYALHATIVAAVTVLAVAFGPALPAAHARPLPEELRVLLATHPLIQQRRNQVESTRQGIRRAFAGYLPRLDVSGETGPQYIDSPVAEQSGGGQFLENKEVAGVRLTQRLFDGFATPSQVRAANLNLEVAEFTLAGTRQNVLFEGLASYIEVLRQATLIELARDNEERIRRQLNLEDERVKRGAGIAVDVLQAKSRLQIAKEQRVAFEGALHDAAARYVRLFGRAPDPSTMNLPRLPQDRLPRDLEDAVRLAEDENPAVDSSLATVAVASERRRQARADYFPALEMVASANYEKDNDLVRGTRRDFSIVLAATWNLFNGFATTAGVAQAAFDYRAAQDNHETVRREVIEQTRLAWNEMETTAERVALLDNAVAIASEVFDARQRLRAAGRETAIGVLDAENELSTARIKLTEAKGDRQIATYRVLQGIGRLEPAELGIDLD